MDPIKILFVEDNGEDIESFVGTMKRYEAENATTIDYEICRNLTDAKAAVDSSFDGAIIDLKLAADGDEGNQIIDTIHDNYRIPISVLTGTPENVRKGQYYVGVHKKGEVGYSELLDEFFRVFDTGLTRIIGGRGVIEKAMNDVFWNNLLPHLDAWKAYAADGRNTETALLRFAISHLIEILSDTAETSFAEEAYITPPKSDTVKTGSIVTRIEDRSSHIVLSPACDLTPHNGTYKTDRILVCAIEHTNSLIKSLIKKSSVEIREGDKDADSKSAGASEAEQKLLKIVANGYSRFYHYLPKTEFYPGGVVCFRKISTYKPKEFQTGFEAPTIQVAAPFTKDIVARFSSYYARQGQPDFDFEELVSIIKASR